MIKLKHLKLTSGNIAKKEFLRQNKFDHEFIECVRFLSDNMIVTNISSKKFNKIIELDPTYEIN